MVDQILYEVTKIQNDPKGEVTLKQLHNQIDIVETNVGAGYRTRRARNPQESSANLGEIAVDEYATSLARMSGQPLYHWYCLKIPTLWNCGLPVSRTFTFSTLRAGS
jgi:hypothetical protein